MSLIDITYFVNHVALWMPVFIHTMAIDFNKLLQDSSFTSSTTNSKLDRIMIVAIDLVFMLIVRIVRTENSWANGAGEMLNVIFSVKGCNV